MLADALGVLCFLLVLAALVWLWPHARVKWPPKPLSPDLVATLNAPRPPVPNCRCAAPSLFDRIDETVERLETVDRLIARRNQMALGALESGPVNLETDRRVRVFCPPADAPNCIEVPERGMNTGSAWRLIRVVSCAMVFEDVRDGRRYSLLVNPWDVDTVKINGKTIGEWRRELELAGV